MNRISVAELPQIFISQVPLIDVRAPVEFAQGSLPGAVNLPLLNNEEREAVGTTYKHKGREAALELGYKLISGPTKQTRMELWKDFIRTNPNSIIYCFRGGLRSQITQQWLSEEGIDRPLIKGGYKSARRLLMNVIDEFASATTLKMISGPTGSGKTHFLETLEPTFATIDLEGCANHRGSAFGGRSLQQPSQVDFEHRLALQILKLRNEGREDLVFVEDESRLIGRCAIPESFFKLMRASEVIFLEESLETRVENIFKDYILQTEICEGSQEAGLNLFMRYKRSLQQISNKLGGLRTEEIGQDLDHAIWRYQKNADDLSSNRVWIEKLLVYYYDPMYRRSFTKRNPKVLFKGQANNVLEFLNKQQSSFKLKV